MMSKSKDMSKNKSKSESKKKSKSKGNEQEQDMSNIGIKRWGKSNPGRLRTYIPVKPQTMYTRYTRSIGYRVLPHSRRASLSGSRATKPRDYQRARCRPLNPGKAPAIIAMMLPALLQFNPHLCRLLHYYCLTGATNRTSLYVYHIVSCSQFFPEFERQENHVYVRLALRDPPRSPALHTAPRLRGAPSSLHGLQFSAG